MDWNPGTLLEMSGYYWKTCTLHAGVKLDIFTLIGANVLSGKTIAKNLGMDQRGVILLLNGLTALGLLVKKNQSYANTPESAAFLSKNSPQYIGHMILHHHHLAPSWVNMDKAIARGGPVRQRSSVSTEEWRESFLMGMFNMGMAVAPGLAKALDLTGCKHLLDLGGGPGTFAIHFCLENPGLLASVCDLPTTRPFAENTIKKFRLEDRISFVPGDYTKKRFCLEQRFDAAWLSHILHGESPEMAEKIIARALTTLRPGGKIFIHEFILNNTMDGPLFPALFSLNMFLGTKQGQSYGEEQLIDMLVACGVKNIVRLDFIGPTQSGILAGRME
ncbi:MAG: methyltransferase domain-containing protein [Proteobacteria bacterium]|nr:methyltransferase domain-containing protein [Desulfobacula sp.]MBU3951899.1 methyltransferase domain-containing protein [Pseudomonadota bacterium]MBU4129977.1 methyltransferase domain-containing protein [Pseudomonadota bacterium]